MGKYVINMADQLLKVRENVQRLKEETIKEAKYQVNYSKNNKLYSRTINARNEDDAEEKAIKRFKIDDDDIRSVVKEETLNEFKKASVEFDRRNKSDMMKAKKDLEKKGHKVDVSGSMITVTAKRGSDIGREIKDVMNFYNGAKRAKALESVEEETLDEGRMKELAMKIAQVYSNMKKDKNMRSFADKFRKDVAKSLDIRKSLEKVLPDYVAGKDITNIMSKHVPGHKEEGLEEAKSPSDILFHFNSLNDAKKFNDYAEKNKQKLGIKQVVHFTKGQDVYASSVNIQPKDGISLSAFEILYKGLDKIAKKFKSVKSIKYLQNSVEEAKLIDKPTGEVLKTGSKKEMETERKRNRDELQVQEWFKSKNIDVKVRQLDESTQVYVPIGRRIPNEIREELITTQYGKMPEDVKNVKDINYGNFVENSITMNNDFWSKVLHGTKGE